MCCNGLAFVTRPFQQALFSLRGCHTLRISSAIHPPHTAGASSAGRARITATVSGNGDQGADPNLLVTITDD